MAVQFGFYHVEIEVDVVTNNGFFAGFFKIANEFPKHLGNGMAFFTRLIFGDAMNHRCARRNPESIRLNDVVLQLLNLAIRLRHQPSDADDSQLKPFAWMVVGFGIYEDEAHWSLKTCLWLLLMAPIVEISSSGNLGSPLSLSPPYMEKIHAVFIEELSIS